MLLWQTMFQTSWNLRDDKWWPNLNSSFNFLLISILLTIPLSLSVVIVVPPDVFTRHSFWTPLHINFSGMPNRLIAEVLSHAFLVLIEEGGRLSGLLQGNDVTLYMFFFSPSNIHYDQSSHKRSLLKRNRKTRKQTNPFLKTREQQTKKAFNLQLPLPWKANH